jgi:hypothetical protein
MYNQNFEDAKFNFNQVEKLLAHLRSERAEAEKPLLLVLHQRRVRGGPANAPYASKLVKTWRENSACAPRTFSSASRVLDSPQLTRRRAVRAQTSCSRLPAARTTIGIGCTRRFLRAHPGGWSQTTSCGITFSRCCPRRVSFTSGRSGTR